MKCIGMMLSVAGVLVWSLGAFGSSARILSVDCQGEISGGQVTARVVVTNLSDKSLSVSVSGTILDHAVGKESLDVGAKVVDGNDCNALNARKAAAGGVVISGYKAKLRPRAVRTITISETVESPKPLPTSYDMNLTLYDANGPCDSRTVSFAFEKGAAGDYNRDFTTGTAGSVSSAACGVQCAAVAKSEMQSAVQKILDDAVASGAQSACQCCVYIDGKLVVDAWAGTMATNSAEKINGSSLFPIFSTEKAQFVTAVHIAHERGKFDYEAKIRDYWPEFRGGNKDELTVRQLLGMRTGLPGVPPRQTTDDQLCDWNFMTDWCARSETKHPGRPGYLGRTWGWYLGKVLENVYGRPINDVLTDEVLKPCGIENDYYFAVPDSELKRVVTVYNGKENYNFEEMNKNCCRKACVPSSFAVANARAIAKFYLRLSGQDGKPPLIKRETLMNALKVNRADDDPLPDAETLRKNWQTVWGLGYTMWGERDELDRIMGSGGLGGSEGFCDLKNRICIGYTCAVSATACGKPWDIRPDIYRTVGIRTRYVNAAKSTPAQRTMCNPLPIEDYPLGVHCRGLANGSKPARDSETWLTPDGTTRQFRELADPALLCAGKSWYLYPSAEMCYRSDDGGASWKHISLHMSGSRLSRVRP